MTRGPCGCSVRKNLRLFCQIISPEEVLDRGRDQSCRGDRIPLPSEAGYGPLGSLRWAANVVHKPVILANPQVQLTQ